MKNTKDMAIKCLDTLYNSTNQSEVDKTMYDRLIKYIEQFDMSQVKETKIYKDLELEWFHEKQMCEIYKARLRKIDNILTGRFDRD